MSADMTVATLVALGRDVVKLGMTPGVTRRLQTSHLDVEQRWAVLRALEWMSYRDEEAACDHALRRALDEEYTNIIAAAGAAHDAMQVEQPQLFGEAA